MDRLHPALQQLLEADGWTGLSATQEAAFPPLLARRHALVIAPTGTGKTEAAVLPILHHLLTERDRLGKRPWPDGFKALYITPLRALNRDLMRRLEAWCEALGFTVGVRHGDTSQSERAKQARKPPDILITTPETTQLLLYGDKLRGHLRTVRFVVVDEVHDLATSERGAQLAVALERIEEVVAQPPSLLDVPAKQRVCPRDAAGASGFQRIGLSATVAEPQAIAQMLGGARDVDIVTVDTHKRRVVHVVHPDVRDEDQAMAGELAAPVEAIAQLRVVRDIVQRHARVLVFLNTRDAAELMTSRSAMIDEAAGRTPMLELHHGSLSAEHRADVETRFRDGGIHGLVATSSLELGIDVGAIDHVVQVQSPRSAARFIQRLGRAGHRIGATSEGTIVSTGPEDHLECLAVARMAQDGELEPLPIRHDPLVVLANQLVALSNEYSELDPHWTRQVVSRAGPFLELDGGMFEASWETLIDVQTLPEASPGRIGRSGRGRRQFLRHISLIPDTSTYGILDEATKRRIGAVDDDYVAAAMRPGDLFVMAGRPWKVLEVDAERKMVRVGPTRQLGAIPQWSGEMLPVGYHLAQAVARLRGEIAAGRQGPDVAAAEDAIRRHMDGGLVVPTDRVVTLDVAKGVLVAGVALGTRGNDALGRITAALLHQRTGTPVAVESDAYRIHFTGPATPQDVEDLWRSLDPDTIDLLLGMVIKDQPIVKQHLVHVAKHFGALPPDLDPNRFSRKKMEELWGRVALQEETLSRLLHDRFDLDAVRAFLRSLDRLEMVAQGLGPLSRMPSHQARLMIVPRRDERLLEAVRRRVMEADVMLVCTHCRSRLDMTVADVPTRVHCRRCGRNAVACMRPWQEDLLPSLSKDTSAVDPDIARRRRGLERNGRLMADHGQTAAACLVGRGIGADAAARILQKCSDLDDPTFWRLILEAELEFAQNSAWRQRK